MLFWIILAACAVLAAMWIARPFLVRGTMEMESGDSTISIYRDQLDEVDRDCKAGLISADESEAARREIERRALAAARRLDQGFFVGKRSVAATVVISGLAAAGALGLYFVLGTPDAGDQPLAARRSEMLAERAAKGDPQSQVQLLIAATQQQPEDFESWWLLAQAHSALGDDAAAADAYRHAAELSGDDPAVLSAYAEAMTLANGNKVPAAARVIFEQVLNARPDPRARYYLALARAQAQDFEGALDDWAALARDSVPEAPWMPLVRRDIVNMARFLKTDVTNYLPDATPAEIALAGGGATGDAGLQDERIAALRDELGADPMDHESWIELATLEVSAGNTPSALEAMAQARRHFRAAPFVLGKLDTAAAALGLDILATAEAVAGPTEADIAAAADMTQEEEDEMIGGMVAGLAAKLAENPDNPDGWIMLIRSYVVLGDVDKARDAYAAAEERFSGDENTLAKLRDQAASVLAP